MYGVEIKFISCSFFTAVVDSAVLNVEEDGCWLSRVWLYFLVTWHWTVRYYLLNHEQNHSKVLISYYLITEIHLNVYNFVASIK